MAEGFFHLSQLAIPGVPEARLCAAMVRVLPKTMLVLDLAASPEEARDRARNESRDDGSEWWYRFFTGDDVDRVGDPQFSMGMVRHEFSRVVLTGGTFPATMPLDGGGSGFAIDCDGHVLTNYHLVIGEVARHQRESGTLHDEVLCRGLRAQTAARIGQDGWEWTDAQQVRLVSNPPRERALRDDTQGLLHPREDTALLRVSPPPGEHLALSARVPVVGETVWMAGFPLRSARSARSLAEIGYEDADGTLRVCKGVVTEVEGAEYFTTDLDGSMGNSGSPVVDAEGKVIGMFSRATGDGPRNAVEYGHVQRVHVTTALAMTGLGLEGREGRT
jgi:S1-C subfamily serine protease